MALSLNSASAMACSAPSPEMSLDLKGLIRLSSSIVLAKAVEENSITNERTGESYYSLVKFEVASLLKGEKIVQSLVLKSVEAYRDEHDFNRHEDSGFWASETAGSGHTVGDCKTYGSYKVGNTYLLFLDVINFKAHEPIYDLNNDRWLNLVKDTIENEKTGNKVKN